ITGQKIKLRDHWIVGWRDDASEETDEPATIEAQIGLAPTGDERIAGCERRLSVPRLANALVRNHVLRIAPPVRARLQIVGQLIRITQADRVHRVEHPLTDRAGVPLVVTRDRNE